MTEKGPKFLRLEVPGLSENRPSVLPGDRIYAQVFSDPNQAHPEQHEYEGNVHEVEESAILVGFNAKLRKRFINNMRFNIRFTFNRFPLRNMHRAAEYIAHNPEYSSYVFPTASSEELRSSVTSASGINFFEKDIAQNTEVKINFYAWFSNCFYACFLLLFICFNFYDDAIMDQYTIETSLIAKFSCG